MIKVKACLARGYIPRYWGAGQDDNIPAPGKINYTQAKAYCPTSLLSSMQETMQKLMTRNIKGETLGHVPYIYNKCLQTKEVHRNRSAPCNYTYTGSSRKQEVTLELS